MKKLARVLTLCLVSLALLCAAVPAAFAASAAEEQEGGVYAIGLDAAGGECSTVVVYTSTSGKLAALPESPVMEGYTFKGWFTDIVDGSAIVAGETVFSGEEATVYAQWSPIDQVPTEPTAPADTAAGILERHKGTILIVGGMLVLVAVGLAM